MGSYARGRADLFTDLDLLVVMETNLSFIDRLRMLYPLLALPVDLDLLCYTRGVRADAGSTVHKASAPRRSGTLRGPWVARAAPSNRGDRYCPHFVR
ncbi:nucleotidyltransferase domain-containing protein [Candidatus Methylomirabilis sp.]|uniref:nucleotidyltransferase domain-containing protein n=1 Tax=Candidatus Methylomirabilis sp. TaxID=2032687 RepID=UPI003C722D0F